MPKVTILVIDDDPEILSLFTRFFENETTHIEAVSKLPAVADVESMHPTLIIVDCWIGGILLGPQFVTEIRKSKNLATTKIGLTSSDMQMEQRAAEVGANYWLPKPLQWEVLEVIISQKQ